MWKYFFYACEDKSVERKLIYPEREYENETINSV